MHSLDQNYPKNEIVLILLEALVLNFNKSKFILKSISNF